MKIDIISAKIECPYCGHINEIVYNVNNYNTDDVIYCDCENGGCDQPFVIKNCWSIHFDSVILKIEGMKTTKKAIG